MKDSNFFSLIKAISWRAFGTSATWVVAFFLTGDVVLSTKFSIIECASKVGLYYLHERMWQTNLRVWSLKIWNGSKPAS